MKKMTDPSDSMNFYRSLPAQTEFTALSEARSHQRVPSDWRLILTDIRGSTRAIEEGRYKDVNTIGAASIAAAQSIMGHTRFPFVFGGDGATLLVPEADAGKVLSALAGLRRLSKERFDLELRVGSISIAELDSLDAPVEVAKFAVSPTCQIAALRGKGLQIAENRIKHENSPYEYRETESRDPNLAGLSCRWRPFRSRHGKFLALIIEPRADSDADPGATTRRILEELSGIFPEGIEGANPAACDLRGYRPLREILLDEVRYQRKGRTLLFLKRVMEAFFAGRLFHLPLQPSKIRNYLRDTAAHTDYRKIDTHFRAVLHCDPHQVCAIERLLADEYHAGAIYFGLHESEEALMTCLVEGLAPGEHLHFIDAAGGGYAIASARLKAQKTESPGRSSPGTFKN